MTADPIHPSQLTHIGTSKLRRYTASQLREMEQAVIVCQSYEPLAVLIPYALYMRWQRLLTEATHA